VTFWIAARFRDHIGRMVKLITFLAAAIPILMFVKTMLGKSKVLREASAEFRKQVDYLVWGILILVGCALVYSTATLIYSIYK
jgi:hypothetical protein